MAAVANGLRQRRCKLNGLPLIYVVVVLLLPQMLFGAKSSTNARWTIAGRDNARSLHSHQHSAPFEQRWGQVRRLQQELATITTSVPPATTTLPSSSRPLPKLVDWREWQRMRNNTGLDNTPSGTEGPSGQSSLGGVPVLIVARGNDRMVELEEAEGKKPLIRPPEAEEEEAELTLPNESSGRAADWHEGSAHIERTLAMPAGVKLLAADSDGARGKLLQQETTMSTASTTTPAMSTTTTDMVTTVTTFTTVTTTTTNPGILFPTLLPQATMFPPASSQAMFPPASSPQVTMFPSFDFDSFRATTSSTPISTTLSSTTLSPAASRPSARVDSSPSSAADPMNLFSSGSSSASSGPGSSPLDLRQLPSLMLLLKQIPAMLKSFSTDAAPPSFGGNTVATHQNQAVLPSGNGLLQQMLSPPPVASGTPLLRLQSRAVQPEKGYGSGDSTGADQTEGYGSDQQTDNALESLPSSEMEADDGAAAQTATTSTVAVAASGPITLPRASSVRPAAAGGIGMMPMPIVPLVATHGLKTASAVAAGTNYTNYPPNEGASLPGGGIKEAPEGKSAIASGSREQRRKQQRLNIYGVTAAPPRAYTAPPPNSHRRMTTSSKRTTPTKKAAKTLFTKTTNKPTKFPATTTTTAPTNPSEVAGTARTRRPRPQFDIERLTVGELGQLERIHRKLFTPPSGNLEEAEEVEDGWRQHTNNVPDTDAAGKEPSSTLPAIVPPAMTTPSSGNEMPPATTADPPNDAPRINTVQHAATTHRPASAKSSSPLPMDGGDSGNAAPRQVPSGAIVTRGGQSKQTPPLDKNGLGALVAKGVELGQLDQSMLNELLAVGELPDLEELTQGMDLSQLHRPGGFAVLKQQFIERMLQRALQQPPQGTIGNDNDNNNNLLRKTRR